jgi:hypothetical protein
LVPALVFARDAREQARIDFLIHGVETSTRVKFIRNGTEHDATAAATHLRQKLSYFGERIKTAEQFVKYCASESSLTHRPYGIRLPDGTTKNASDYFTEQLREFDDSKKR